MKANSLTRLAAAAIASTTLAYAQANDDCGGAIAVGLGATAFDTTSATLSPEAWPCAASTAPDLWYSYTAANTNDIRIETCGNATYDTALEVFTGTCGALTSLICNDDNCGLQSGVDITGVTAGTTYLFRVGGFGANSGTGSFDISEVTPPPPPASNCVETLFATNNGGSVDGAVYFDMTLTQAITVSGILTNTSSTATGLGADLYMFPGTHVGNEAAAGWVLLAQGDLLGTGAGTDQPTALDFVTAANIPAGTNGFAIAAVGFNHRYTNGNGANQMHVSPDGVITLNAGSATNVAFAGNVFSPRVWNGRLCSDGPSTVGTNYCMANANSTGVPTVMSASGSASVASNDLVLEASDMPLNSFSFFITSQTQGFVANPNGSQGNLCVGGSIGRYVGPGQIQNSGAAGAVSLAVDNSLTPQPMGLVQVVAGETWNFQLWHRDFVGGPTSNFSDGLEITFSM